MAQHVKILGVLHIISGALMGVGALVVLLVFGGAAGLIGIAGRGEPGAQVAAPLLGFVGTALFLFLLLLSVPSFVAGIGLINFRSWARILTIVLSVFHLFSIPIGTALGVYGFWVLLSHRGAELFNGPPGPPVRV